MGKNNSTTEAGIVGKQWSLFINAVLMLVLLLCGVLGYLIIQPDLTDLFVNKKIDTGNSQFVSGAALEDDVIENGIHRATGMPYDDRFPIVKATCTACHSAKLVTQNRATREGWKQMIVWMQETQGLWELGGNEAIILDYLAEYYAPKKTGRRASLTDVEWYILELEE